MRQIVAEDSPITKKIVPLEEAVKLFEERGDDDKVRLLEQRTRSYPDALHAARSLRLLLRLHGSLDRLSEDVPAGQGERRLHPAISAQRHADRSLTTIQPYSKIGAVFAESEDWLKKLGVEDIGRLNRIVRNDRIQELILSPKRCTSAGSPKSPGEISERHQSRACAWC